MRRTRQGEAATMIGEKRDKVEDEEVDEELDSEEDEEFVAADEEDDSDNVGDISVEINVDELVAKLESTNSDDIARRREIRRRLEELQEQRRAARDLDSTYNFNLDDDL